MRFVRIRLKDLPRWQSQLEALEQLSVYPLGNDSFRISHGQDYFAFFQRLGDVRYYALHDHGRLVAVGCGVLRPRLDKNTPRRWYVGDFKVHPDYRGQHLLVSIFRRAFWQNYVRCPRGYAIAMNPPDHRVPPAVRAFAHFKWLPMSLIDVWQLDIYAADAAALRPALPLLGAGRGPPRFISLLGTKDLVLQSTQMPLPLLHLAFAPRRDSASPQATEFAEPQELHTHMWCVPQASALTTRLAAAGFTPTASATVVSHRLNRFDPASIDTSEI